MSDEINKISWEKPSGMVIETNDNEATIAYCKSLGWTREGVEYAPEPEMPEAPEGFEGDITGNDEYLGEDVL